MRDLMLKPALKEAWDKVHGSKKSFFFVFFAMAILQFIGLGIESVTRAKFPGYAIHFQILLSSGLFFICSPLIAGSYMLGAKRGRDETVQPQDGFQYFQKIIPLFFTQILNMVTIWVIFFGISFIAIAFLFLAHRTHSTVFIVSAALVAMIFLLIFLSLAALLSFALILVADQNKLPWDAYKTSIKMAFPHLKVLVLAELVCALFDILGAIPLGIGLLWTIPFSYIVTGVFYRKIFISKP